MAFRFMARLVAPTIILAVGLLLLGGVAAWYLHRLQREASGLLVVSVAKVRAAKELELISNRLRARLDEFLLTGDRTSLAAVPALQKQAAGWIEEAKGLANSPQEDKVDCRNPAGLPTVPGRIRESRPRSPAGPTARGDCPPGSARDQRRHPATGRRVSRPESEINGGGQPGAAKGLRTRWDWLCCCWECAGRSPDCWPVSASPTVCSARWSNWPCPYGT